MPTWGLRDIIYRSLFHVFFFHVLLPSFLPAFLPACLPPFKLAAGVSNAGEGGWDRERVGGAGVPNAGDGGRKEREKLNGRW
jgi:hypothetical protein